MGLTNFPFNVYVAVPRRPINSPLSPLLIVFCQSINKQNCIGEDIHTTDTVEVNLAMQNEFGGGGGALQHKVSQLVCSHHVVETEAGRERGRRDAGEMLRSKAPNEMGYLSFSNCNTSVCESDMLQEGPLFPISLLLS